MHSTPENNWEQRRLGRIGAENSGGSECIGSRGNCENKKPEEEHFQEQGIVQLLLRGGFDAYF